jgi:hypothetical protein
MSGLQCAAATRLAASHRLWSDPAPVKRRHPVMAFEDLKAELALLINQMENQPEDRHELYLQIRERLNEMRAFGMPVPEDLVKFEEQLEAQFKAEDAAAKKS